MGSSLRNLPQLAAGEAEGELRSAGRLVEDLAEGAVDEVVGDAGGAAGADGHVADAAEMIDKRPIDLVAEVLLPVVMHRLVGQDLVDRRAVKIPMLKVRRLIAREGQGDVLPIVNIPRLLVFGRIKASDSIPLPCFPDRRCTIIHSV